MKVTKIVRLEFTTDTLAKERYGSLPDSSPSQSIAATDPSGPKLTPGQIAKLKQRPSVKVLLP